jgi:hypothetical protein
MRSVLFLSGCLALFGCQGGPSSPNQKGEKQPVIQKAAKRTPPPKQAKPQPPSVIPASGISGRVALVNNALRYVIVDFSLSEAPKPEQKMSVYRQGAKVGEVKISEQSQALNFAADIVAGEVQVGDMVRLD